MKKWTADFTNNPYDDYNLIVEILYDNEDVAVIQKGADGLEIKWYPTTKEIVVPLDWLAGLLKAAQMRIG